MAACGSRSASGRQARDEEYRDSNKQNSTPYVLKKWNAAADGVPRVPSLCASASSRRLSSPQQQRFLNEDVCEAQQDNQTRKSVFILWTWEILSLFLATCILVVTTTVIVLEDDRRSRDWPLDGIITLNSLVNLLSTIFRGILVSIATELIAQAKWMWFWFDKSSRRRMGDLLHFDDGTRGVWGALKLIKIVTWRSPSILIAVVVLVSSFAVGFFVQQSIRYIDRNEPLGLGSGSLPVTRHIDGLNTRVFYTGGLTFKPEVKGAIQSLAFRRSRNESAVIPICPTGNCTFTGLGSNTSIETGSEATHASAGVCSICTDVGEMINHSNNDPRYSLPNDMEIVTSDKMEWVRVLSGDLSWSDATIPPEALALASAAFANVTVLTGAVVDGDIRKTKTKHPVAITCSLYPCVRTYSGIIRLGSLNETLIRETPMHYDMGDNDSSASEQALNLSAGPNLSTVRHARTKRRSENNSSSQVPEECIYRIDQSFKSLISDYLSSDFFNGSCTWDSSQRDMIECGEAIWLSKLWANGNSTTESLADLFTDFATALTNQVRFGMGRKDGTTSMVKGVAFQLVTFIAVEKYWLVFPAVLLILEIAALSWMISLTVVFRGELAVWKGSILPLLFYRDFFWGNGDRGKSSKRLLTTKEMEKQADQISANFSRNI
ncbi:hypothetical protein CORC01_10972 [Colletotrichum orchidophilum]|uniref:Uncharacterized protein n=1 Tax=Colletotrichum orchidophilum TaxID=1209926 RepID=A0A1G4AXA8_9PEZI|nr:uncharacterized protein CORC01_10972 [Colletotrichum orchidophilum]OHE93745.1 hypothetical protein CORC01_10972 [Colletotrichum orchidophilum]